MVNGDFSQGNSNFSTDYQFITNAGQGGVQRAYGIVSSANSWFQFFQAREYRPIHSSSVCACVSLLLLL